jgi:hypothetical protein
MDAKLPALLFYVGDWRKDIGVQSLNFFDRGVWFETLLLMHASEERGKLVLNGRPIPVEALSQALGLPVETLTQTLKGLLDYGVLKQESTTGILYNKRMVVDEAARRAQQAAGRRGGNPQLTDTYHRPGCLYLVQRADDGAVRLGMSEHPAKRLAKLRAQHRGVFLQLLVSITVDDMAATRAALLTEHQLERAGDWLVVSPEECATLCETLKGYAKGYAKGYPNPTPTPSVSIAGAFATAEEKIPVASLPYGAAALTGTPQGAHKARTRRAQGAHKAHTRYAQSATRRDQDRAPILAVEDWPEPLRDVPAMLTDLHVDSPPLYDPVYWHAIREWINGTGFSIYYLEEFTAYYTNQLSKRLGAKGQHRDLKAGFRNWLAMAVRFKERDDGRAQIRRRFAR